MRPLETTATATAAATKRWDGIGRLRRRRAKRGTLFRWLDGACAVASLVGLTFGITFTAPADAQNVRTVQATSLRNDRATDAATVAALEANASVSLLQLSGGWAQVQMQSAGNQRGWVRASLLDLRPPEVAPVSQLETGRRAGGANAVTLGSRSLPPRSNRHALIIGIGRYLPDNARPVESLGGVDLDMASALVMARSLQVPDDNITLLRDEAATNDGIAAAIKALGERAQPGDRVFVYWSGHGSRYFDASEGGCVESLVPYDLKDVTNRQVARWLKPVGDKADKMLVVYDACHSGGVAATADPATRSAAGALQAKYTPGSDACQTPSNVRTRSLSGAAAALGLGGQDFVNISSSRPDELSLQNTSVGGLATNALRQCLLGDARDSDGSGSVSAQELSDCAQSKIEQTLAGNPRFSAPHITLTGNRDFVPAFFASTVAPLAGGPASAAAVSAVSPTVAAPAPMSRVLEQIHEQRDGKRSVTVTAASSRLRIGADALGFTVNSSRAGHVYVAMLGSDGQTLTLLFPNRLDTDNRIAANEPLTLPRERWQLTAGGPRGTDKLLVMVTDGPRDLPALRAGQTGVFVQPLTDAQGRAQLQWLLGTSARQSVGGACSGAECSDAFGSALIDVDEY